MSRNLKTALMVLIVFALYAGILFLIPALVLGMVP